MMMMMVMVRFTNSTFTASQDCLTIPIRVYPVIPVNHLNSFTGLDLTARFSRKLLNGTKGDCVIEKETKYFFHFQDLAQVVYFKMPARRERIHFVV